MADAFLQALKWYLSAALIIGGLWAVNAMETTGRIQPLMIAILCFGGAYIMSIGWRDVGARVVLFSVIFVVAAALAVPYITDMAFVFLNVQFDLGFYPVWLGTVFALGIPFMTLVFYHFDNKFK